MALQHCFYDKLDMLISTSLHTFHPIYTRSLLLLSVHLRRCFRSSFFLQVFSLKICMLENCLPHSKIKWGGYFEDPFLWCNDSLINFIQFVTFLIRVIYCSEMYKCLHELYINTFTTIVDLSRFNNSCLKSPASTLVDLTFQSRAIRSFSLNQLRNLSL